MTHPHHDALAAATDAAVPLDAPRRATRDRMARVRAYVALTKPKIIRLLLVTTVPAMVVAARGVPDLWTLAATLVGGALAAGSANAVNCWADRDIDALMRRTAHRPLVRSTVAPGDALRFGVALGAAAFLWLAATVNLAAAALAIAANLFYVFVYTLGLKRRTAQNIVIGGAAGCAPVLVGWAAVTGGIALPALLLFSIVFAWTPPHFWALALRYRHDYARASVPMLPVVRGARETARQIMLYALLLLALSLMFGAVAQLGVIYLVTALLAGGLFVASTVRLTRRPDDDAAAMTVFHLSISYLTVLFAAMAVDVIVLG